MVVGFNHNFRYKGEMYHVQTEDGGIRSPHIITLLYKGGTILGSKKTSYADIVKVDNLDQVVEELMKEQHKEMLRRLKEGEFDAIIGGRMMVGTPAEVPPVAPRAPVAPARTAPSPAPPAAATVPPGRPTPPTPPRAAPTPPPQPKKAEPVAAAPPKPVVAPAPAPVPEATVIETTLDDIILSYLIGEDGKGK